MTVYDSMSGKEIQSLPAPETMDGVYYDANLKRVYMTGGRWYGTPDASPGRVYVYQQKDPSFLAEKVLDCILGSFAPP